MPRPSNKTQRREEIVNALQRVMAEKGYDGASITAIAKAAGLAPGLIHYHFKSKQEILIELVKSIVDFVESRNQALSEMAKTPRDRIQAFIDARLKQGKDSNPSLVGAWVMISAEAVRQPEVQQIYQNEMRKQSKHFGKLLQEASCSNLSAEELKHISGAVLGMIEGIYQLSISAHGVMPKNYAAKTVMKLIEPYLQR